MLMFSFLFRFAHDKHALLDLETIDDDLDQIGETIYCLLLFLVTLCYLLLTHFIFCPILLLLHFVTFCYFLLSFVSYFFIFQGVHMVRLEDQNGEYADKYELDVVPCLVLFHEKRPRVFKGQISDEKEAIKWFREIVASFED